MATQISKNLIQLILSNFDTKELAEEVIISDLKNSTIRKEAIKYYRKFYIGEDVYSFNPNVGKGEFGFGKFLIRSESGVNTGQMRLLSTNNCYLDGNQFQKKSNFNKFKGTLSIDDKIIDCRGPNEKSYSMFGNVHDIKTGEIFYSAKVQTNLQENQIISITGGHGTLNFNNVKFIIPKQEESTHSYLKDKSGEKKYCKMNYDMFPSNYEGKIYIRDCLYDGTFYDFETEGKKGFTGTVNNISHPEIIFVGDCDLSGLPQIGEGKYLYQGVVYDGRWEEKDEDDPKGDKKFIGEAYSIESPTFKFKGTYFDFEPYSGKGEFMWDGILYKGTVEDFHINATCYSGKEYVCEIRETRYKNLLIQGDIKFGHFLYSFEKIDNFAKLKDSKSQISGKISHKGRTIYQGDFYNYHIFGEGFLSFNSKMYNKGIIYSILENEI